MENVIHKGNSNHYTDIKATLELPGYIYVPGLRQSSRTSSSFQDVRPDGPVVQNGHDSSRNSCHTLRLSPTQLNSTRLSGSVAGPLGSRYSFKLCRNVYDIK